MIVCSPYCIFLEIKCKSVIAIPIIILFIESFHALVTTEPGKLVVIMRGIIANDLPKYLVLLVWLGLNAFIFAHYYGIYDKGERYRYTRVLLGTALALARGSAACLNFNCMLILIPVCRNLISLLRGWAICCPRRVRRILDKNITFHKLCAYMIVLMTGIHYWAHSFNVQFYCDAQSVETNIAEDSAETIKNKNLIMKLAVLGNKENETYIDPIRKPIFPVASVFILTGGWTGVIITVALFLMVTSSTEFIRRSYFEVFWFTHHLFIVFFAFLVFHGYGRQVRSQTNINDHDPSTCENVDVKDWQNSGKCSTTPQFAGSAPGTWKWVIAPMVLYAFERVLRFIRYSQNVEILKVIKHPSRVIELQMRKKGFSAEVGQYIFIQCPQLSFLEWHPFTLTSAPEENYFSVHIRIVGDWTGGISKVVGADGPGQEIQPAWKMPHVAVDGPFGTASEDVFEYDVALCVGSGIGVTPFASMLKSVYYKNVSNREVLRLKKVYFFWICPDTHAFEWFGDMLKHLENQLVETGQQDLIEYNIYLTRGWSAKQAKAIFVHEEDERDVITGLEQKTNYGRPNWDEIFKRISTDHPDSQAGVFFCGVAALSRVLHQMCNKHSTSKMVFHYNKENF